MIRAQLEGVDFLVANTDAQSLNQSLVEDACRIQLGPNITKGLGAGSKPDVGQGAAEESASDILPRIKDSNMVFITAGMGGGTGTGAAPVIARIARDAGILTVGVVTKPFYFEGAKRAMSAEKGVLELKRHVDTLIIIPNQNLFRVANEQTTFSDAFKMADEVLYSGVRGVTDLMIMPGLINLDFADVKAVMAEMGNAMMGTGESDCERRAVDAAEAAIANPLLDDVSLKGAKGVLISITGGKDMTLFEVDEATNRIREDVDNDANIIFGATFDERLEGRIRVSVVATGIGLTSAEEELPAEPEPIAPKDEPLLGVGNMLRKSFGAHAFSAHNNLYAAPPSELEDAPAHENCAFVNDEYSEDEPSRRYADEADIQQRNGIAQSAPSGSNTGRYPYQGNVPAPARRPSLLERLTRSSRRANYEGTQRPDSVDQDSVDIPAFLLRDKNTKQ
jgi:cell division protein FtsZ